MFYIVQMADFHFGGSHLGSESEKDILKKMAERIQAEIPSDAEVVFCACGDYIDSKPVSDGTSTGTRDLTDAEVESRYEEAKDALMSTVIDPLKKKYKYKFKVGLCVGNHDTTHIDAVNRFSQAIASTDIDKTYSLHLDSENVDLIFINSCPPSDFSHGQIDYDYLENTLKTLPADSTKYFILHHTLMSMDERDQSSIRQVPKLIELINQYAVKAVFHGHTHGQYMIRIGTEGCPIISVGAAYVRDFPNVNSQFNLIRCNSGIPISADNYQYHADWAMNPGTDGFEKISIPISKENNYFYGTTFSRVYDELTKKVRAESKLYHVNLHVKSRFDQFCSDVTENFGKKVELKTFDKEYSYTELAEMWQDSELDEKVLYFNHGKNFCTKQHQSGIDYIIHELSQKMTSSRAVLVTVNSKDISQTAPDALLPSLLSIQVGFDRDMTTLHITMNLRALEANRFLKINICEILFLAQKIHETYPFQNIEVAVSAFRVQIKEQFGCFLKAKLDTLAQSNEMAITLACLRYSNDPTVITGQIEYVIRLIRDKKLRSETVIVTAGVENLLNSIMDVKNGMPAGKETLLSKLDQVCTYTKNLLDMLNELKKRRASHSEPTEDMDALEEDIEHQYDLLIEGFERLKEP
ncbi:MAG: hypothetical protein HDT35_06185 [Clostridiales bacterium]|nr:hypothetical protein [Clostridiales bacterium]